MKGWILLVWKFLGVLSIIFAIISAIAGFCIVATNTSSGGSLIISGVICGFLGFLNFKLYDYLMDMDSAISFFKDDIKSVNDKNTKEMTNVKTEFVRLNAKIKALEEKCKEIEKE